MVSRVRGTAQESVQITSGLGRHAHVALDVCVSMSRKEDPPRSHQVRVNIIIVIAPGAGSFLTMYSSDLFLRPASKL